MQSEVEMSSKSYDSMVSLTSHHERSSPLVVTHVQIRSLEEEVRQHQSMSVHRCKVDGSHSLLVARFHLGSVLEAETHCL